MNLLDALEILKRPIPEPAAARSVFLACGFTPLHLKTFLAAHLLVRCPEERVEIKTGLYGNLAGNLERFQPEGPSTVCVVIEWTDLDPRLGIRALGGWRRANLSDIEKSAELAAGRLREVILNVSSRVPTIVSPPTLPLPPMFWTSPDYASALELHLQQLIVSLAASLSEQPNVRIANAQLLGELSPPSRRFDPKSMVAADFPYTLPHASALAGMLAGLIVKKPTKKGLITDLDDTLWGGIVGEDGVSGISWQVDRRTHMHGLYQQFLASLAGAGVLIGVASKNDPALVRQAFDRSDLILSKADIFPFEVHWSLKSESVKRILETWNVGADSVVFVDDSPMEVAEVKAAFPELDCMVFPKDDYHGIWDLLKALRGLFGKPTLTEDDSLRLGSIRNATAWRESASSDTSSAGDFLSAAEASITFNLERKRGDARAFELVNKTNQFNLNGKRLTESEWLNFFTDAAAFLLSVSYEDKYGPLGTIAVLMGKIDGRRIHVNTWVMSCRAFSRRIEHQCLRYLFEDLGADTIVFDYQPTSRNGPLWEFFAALLGQPPPTDGVCLSRELFCRNAPKLPHRITKAIHV
jgi:FkbH-like protein